MEIDKENTNTIEITKADNGFIVKQFVWNENDPVNEDGSDKYTEQVTLIPYKSEYQGESEGMMDNYDEKMGFIDLVKYLSENFCYFHYDKYGKHNLEINFNKKGHKLE